MPPRFIKTFGHAGKPVPADWMGHPAWQDRLQSVVFPKYPRSVTRGSQLVYYAAGRQRFCGVMEVLDDEPARRRGPGSERWPWELRLRPLLAIPADDRAPRPIDVGISPLRLRRQSHIRLTDDEYLAIVEAILGGVAHSTGLANGVRE